MFHWLWASDGSAGLGTDIPSSEKPTVTFVSEAHKLWENLQRQFSTKNGVN